MTMMHPLGGLPTWAGMSSPAPQTADDERGTELQGAQGGRPLWGAPKAASPAAGEAAAGGAASAGEIADLAALA